MRAGHTDRRFIAPGLRDDLAPVSGTYARSAFYQSIAFPITPGTYRITRKEIPASGDRFWLSWATQRPTVGGPLIEMIMQAGRLATTVLIPADARWLHIFGRYTTEPTELDYWIERIA